MSYQYRKLQPQVLPVFRADADRLATVCGHVLPTPLRVWRAVMACIPCQVVRELPSGARQTLSGRGYLLAWKAGTLSTGWTLTDPTYYPFGG